MRFNISKVGDYASHNCSVWYGSCPHNCRYCYVRRLFGRYKWACGPLRLNSQALKLCKYADFDDVKCLILQFSGDPLPLAKTKAEDITRLGILIKHLDYLELRGIPTKVLTKNAFISRITKYREPYQHIQLGMSITTDSQNQKETHYWEKGLHSINLRLGALEHLSDYGFSTWSSMEPILPRTQIQAAILEVLDTGVSELWVGKGSYDRRLENAFSWGMVAREVKDLNFPQVHLKKELRQYLKHKYVQAYLY